MARVSAGDFKVDKPWGTGTYRSKDGDLYQVAPTHLYQAVRHGGDLTEKKINLKL